MTQKAHKTDKNKEVLSLGSRKTPWIGSVNEPGKGVVYLGQIPDVDRFNTVLTRFKKAEAVDATPQDLSIVLRWAGGMRVLAGPATLD
jgi:hypothetical protein